MTKKQLVLIVEDDEWVSEGYQTSLNGAGFDTNVVTNGLEAIDSIDSSRPDVVVLDLFLPGPNGLALIHEIRSHEDLESIPVVMITNSAEQISDDELSVYGVSRLLDKSVMQPQDVVTAVRGALM